MKKRLLFALIILALVAMACKMDILFPYNAAPTEATVTAKATATGTPTQALPTLTLAPTETQIPPTPTLVPIVWTLPDPPEANQLPTELSSEVLYTQPPVDCAKANDPNESCSTLKGQLTDGDFILESGQALVMTGDSIAIFNGIEILAYRPSLNTQHDLWVVVNTSSQALSLHMLAPHGSFRGYFEPTDGNWNIQKITHLRDLHLYLFLLPPQTYDRFTPTPVPNCESYYGCEKVDVRVVVFDDNGLHVAAYGLYLEGQPFWQDLLQLLGY